MKGLALPTKESIRSAAEKCPEAREVLKELFPKVFEVEEKNFVIGDIVEHRNDGLGIFKVFNAPLIGVEFFDKINGHGLEMPGSRAYTYPGHGWWYNPKE